MVPIDTVPVRIPSFDDLDLRVDLGSLASSASRLIDELQAGLSVLDSEPPLVRLGYWVLAMGTVGVAVELTRQGLRTKQPNPR